MRFGSHICWEREYDMLFLRSKQAVIYEGRCCFVFVTGGDESQR